MAQKIKYLAVTCESKAEALTLIYLAVCCHVIDQQLRARESPVCDRSANICWPADADPEKIKRANPMIRIQSITEFPCNDPFPNPEVTRDRVLQELRAILAA